MICSWDPIQLFEAAGYGYLVWYCEFFFNFFLARERMEPTLVLLFLPTYLVPFVYTNNKVGEIRQCFGATKSGINIVPCKAGLDVSKSQTLGELHRSDLKLHNQVGCISNPRIYNYHPWWNINPTYSSTAHTSNTRTPLSHLTAQLSTWVKEAVGFKKEKKY